MQVEQLTADAAAAAANAAERQRCLEDQHEADMASAKRRAAAAVRDGCAAAAAEAREAMQRRTAAAEAAAAAATDDAAQARAALERERADNIHHQGLLQEVTLSLRHARVATAASTRPLSIRAAFTSACCARIYGGNGDASCGWCCKGTQWTHAWNKGFVAWCISTYLQCRYMHVSWPGSCP